jgi:ABC-type antimicrobial peptide transport system permease subunit
MNWEGKDPSARNQINRYAESGGLVATAGMQLVQGRDIDAVNYPSDSTACLINEAALALMKFKNPIGEIIYDDPVKWHVVGVIRDYIQESPYQSIKPLIIKGTKDWMGVILVKLNGQRAMTRDVADMERIFRQYNPAYPFEFTFTDEEYAKKFALEQFDGKLAGLFSGLVVCISCLGLFGLAAYMAQARVKEIGVRKVLGASAANITLLLSGDFVKLVILAIVIAIPVAWYAMNNWLSTYEYRVSIGWQVFALSGGLAVLIAVLAVGYQSVRAAIANPAESLRAE